MECEFELNLIQIYKDQFGIVLELPDDLDIHLKVYCHFDFDEYQPDRMDDLRTIGLENKGVFRLDRMVP